MINHAHPHCSLTFFSGSERLRKPLELLSLHSHEAGRTKWRWPYSAKRAQVTEPRIASKSFGWRDADFGQSKLAQGV
jgi:hypothetical protein